MPVSRVHLTFACGDYDRTRALEDGSVQADGIDLTYLRLPVEETFFRMLRHREFDVAEMSLSTYVATLNALENATPPFVALPRVHLADVPARRDLRQRRRRHRHARGSVRQAGRRRPSTS